MNTPTAKPKEQHSMVTGLFRDYETADLAYQAAKDRGYTDEEVSVIMSKETSDRHFPERFPTEAATEHEPRLEHKSVGGATAGAVAGGALGGIVGAIAAIGTAAVIPGLGLVIAGPIAGAFAGMGAGGAAGTLLGGLIGAGIPEGRAKQYEKGVREGGVVVTVRPRSAEDAAHFEETWKAHEGARVHR